MRVLITGASGFVGGHLTRACVATGDQVVGVSRGGAAPAGSSGVALDLLDPVAVSEAVASLRPQVIYHLAALSSVGRSWERPAQTLEGNVIGAINLLEAVRGHAPAARLVWVSSCEVYGPPAELPVSEAAPLAPASPYAISKVAGEQLCELYTHAHALDAVRARPFNHSGPGQRDIFILSSLARQAAQAKVRGAARLRIVTGNPETRRDFSDVRDVVRAYQLLAQSGRREVFNVSSGHSVSAAEQVALVAELIAPIEVEHIVDPARVRAHEIMELTGAPERILQATGWRSEIPFRRTMLDTIDWWEARLRAEGPPEDPS